MIDKFSKLVEKAAKDDDAKGDLEDYRNRQFKIRKSDGGTETSWGESTWGLKKAQSDQSNMLEGDAKKEV